jgi:hypothetical protein
LARGVNAVLKRWLDGKWQPSLPERAQYNLLQLCVEIGDRKRLSVPLWELYRRKIVVGEYQAFRPISLTRVLLQAMIRNPLEGPVSPALWRSFLEEVPDEYLNGGPLDGFSGMLYLPHEGSPEDRVRELAVWLRKLFFRLAEESLFYAALAAMKRAEPGLAYQILKRAGLDIIEEYVAIVKERGPKAIETTLRQTNQTGNREVEEDLGSKFKEVCSALEEILRRDAGVPRLRTKTQLEGLFSSLVNKEFYSPDRDDPRRILALHVREMASVRDPESLKPQLSSFTSVA